MKILLFYTHNQSFLSSFFEVLGLELSRRKNDVKIITIKDFKSKVIRQSSSCTIEIITQKGYGADYLSIFNKIRVEKPDAVISNFTYVNPALLSGRLLGVQKNIVWFHSATEAVKPNKVRIVIKSFFLKLASKIIVNSNSLKNDLIKDYFVSENKIFPIPFWSSVENLPVKQKQKENLFFKIGCPGRIEAVKNQQLIIEAIEKVCSDKAYKVYFAGDGGNKAKLKERITALKLAEETEFLGVLGKEAMTAFYDQMDLVILPSKFEAFGLVFIEALSMGCPVLVSKNFGALSYIDDLRFLERYTFDPNNAEDLAAKINWAMAGNLDSPVYFREIYGRYFVKERIVEMVEEVLTSPQPLF